MYSLDANVHRTSNKCVYIMHTVYIQYIHIHTYMYDDQIFECYVLCSVILFDYTSTCICVPLHVCSNDCVSYVSVEEL